MRKYLLGTITGLSMVVGLAYAITTQTFQNPVPVANGGLATTTAISGLVWGNGTGYTATSTTGSGSVVFQTSPTLITPILGTASGTALTLSGAFYGSTGTFSSTLGVSGVSTLATTTVAGGVSVTTGNIAVTEYDWGTATSTSMTVDFKKANSQKMKIGTSAVTIQFVNSTTTLGQTLTLTIDAPPNGTAGTITWTHVYWCNKTVPTQTTTAGGEDQFSFRTGMGTTTGIIRGCASTNF